MGGGLTGSVKRGISGWSPTMTITASGNISASKKTPVTVGVRSLPLALPPAPPEGPARTFTAVLDAVQLGLDIAGMVPVAGEVCDLTNAIISAGRGNTGDAMLSLAATFPFGGQAATVGKLSNKAVKALAKNADKFDEVVDGGKAIVRKLDDAAQNCTKPGLCFAAGTIVLSESGEKPIETIAVGERVWAFDVINGEWQLHDVVRLFNRDYEGDSVFVSIGDDTIESTDRHPFGVVSGVDLETRPIRDELEPVPLDAATSGRWVESRNLRVGDVLLLRDVST